MMKSYSYLTICLRHDPFLLLLSWNESKLAELRREETTTTYRQRASRLDKWRDATLQAAKDQEVALKLPDALQSFGFCLNCF